VLAFLKGQFPPKKRCSIMKWRRCTTNEPFQDVEKSHQAQPFCVTNIEETGFCSCVKWSGCGSFGLFATKPICQVTKSNHCTDNKWFSFVKWSRCGSQGHFATTPKVLSHEVKAMHPPTKTERAAHSGLLGRGTNLCVCVSKHRGS
jgi:hypothetical protein